MNSRLETSKTDHWRRMREQVVGQRSPAPRTTDLTRAHSIRTHAIVRHDRAKCGKAGHGSKPRCQRCEWSPRLTTALPGTCTAPAPTWRCQRGHAISLARSPERTRGWQRRCSPKRGVCRPARSPRKRSLGRPCTCASCSQAKGNVISVQHRNSVMQKSSKRQHGARPCPRQARGRGRCAPQIRAGTSEATREGALPGSAQGARNTLRRHGPGRPHVLGSGIVEGHVVRAKTRWAADRVIDYWLRRLGRAVRCKQSL